jgi:hypothetical protein
LFGDDMKSAFAFCREQEQSAPVTYYSPMMVAYGHTNWSVRCQVTKTPAVSESSPFYWFLHERGKTITLCASFDNHGGFNESSATVTYLDKEGDEVTPFSFFETGRIRGRLFPDRLSWVGTGPRHNLGFPTATKMNGSLSFSSPDSMSYSEMLFDGQKVIGGIQTSCSPVEQ